MFQKRCRNFFTYRTKYEHNILFIKFLGTPRLVSLVFVFLCSSILTQTQLAPNQSVLQKISIEH